MKGGWIGMDEGFKNTRIRIQIISMQNLNLTCPVLSSQCDSDAFNIL